MTHRNLFALFSLYSRCESNKERTVECLTVKSCKNFGIAERGCTLWTEIAVKCLYRPAGFRQRGEIIVLLNNMGIVCLLLNYASVGEPAGLKWFLLKIMSINCYLRAKNFEIFCKQKEMDSSRPLSHNVK